MIEKKILNLVSSIGYIEDIDVMRKESLYMLRSLLWFDRGIFWTYDPLTGLPTGRPVSVDITIDNLNYYIENVYKKDKIIQSYMQSNQTIIRMTDFLDYNRFVNSPYYAMNCKPFYMHYHLNSFFNNGNSIIGSLCLSRERSSGDFSLKDIEILKLLHPHLSNILKWHYSLHLLYSNLLFLQKKEVSSDSLTQRESEIVKKVISGCSNNEIAKELNISINTVKMHLKNIFSKLNISRRSQLMSLFLTTKAHQALNIKYFINTEFYKTNRG